MRHQNRTGMDIVMKILYLRWDPTNAYFICGIKVIFNTMNLYLFLYLSCITSGIKSLRWLCFDKRSICYILRNNMHSDTSGKWQVAS